MAHFWLSTLSIPSVSVPLKINRKLSYDVHMTFKTFLRTKLPSLASLDITKSNFFFSSIKSTVPTVHDFFPTYHQTTVLHTQYHQFIDKEVQMRYLSDQILLRWNQVRYEFSTGLSYFTPAPNSNFSWMTLAINQAGGRQCIRIRTLMCRAWLEFF